MIAIPFAYYPTMSAVPAAPAVQTQTKCRKLCKRALCPFINGKVIEVANSGDVIALLVTIKEYLQDMNLVNLTTSLHRLAKLCSEIPDAKAAFQHEFYQSVLQDLLAALSEALLKSESSLNDSRRQALSNIVWSLGTLKCVQFQLIQVTASLAHQHLSLFKPFELVSTVWAFAKLSVLHPAVHEIVAPVLCSAAAPIASVVGKLGFRFLAMAAWALVVSGQHDLQLLGKMAARLAPMLRSVEVSPELLVDLAWAFSSAGVRNERLLSELAAQSWRRLGSFEAAELAALCQTLSSEGVACPQFFDACFQQVETRPMPQLQLEAILCAISQARGWQSTTATLQLEESQEVAWQQPSLFAALCGELGSGAADTTKLEAMRCTGSTAHDCSFEAESALSDGDSSYTGKTLVTRTTAWADIGLEDESADEWACDGGGAKVVVQPSTVTCSVKNTFLEYDDEEISEEEADLRLRLPSAVDRLVSMPREEFDAVRLRYQMFRDW